MSKKLISKRQSELAAPASSQELMAAAALAWEDDSAAEQYIQQALAQPDAELDVLVSAYRYYFYKNNPAMALQMATEIRDRIHQTEQWSSDWETLKPTLLARVDEDPIVRLYLSAHAAVGLLQARLGQIEAAQTAATQVKQIEPKAFGAEVLLNILNSPTEEED